VIQAGPKAVDGTVPGPDFPWTLRPAWRASDPATRSLRWCDALDRQTVQQKLTTFAGDYWVCGETGLLTRDNLTPDISDFYDEWWNRPISDAERAKEIQKHKIELARFAPYRQTGRLFEVGSGMGFVLMAAKELGWAIEGNELSPKAAEAASRATGAVVHPGPIENVTLPRDTFDVVICDNVFEHLSTPRRVLTGLADALRPGGVLYMHTLNAQSFSLRKCPKDWLYFRPTHFHIPTIVSLRHCFEAAKLKPLFMRTHGFRMRRFERDKTQGKWGSFVEKMVSNLAGLCRRGHRIEFLLQREA